jgi:hypothetical protein
VTGFRKVIQVRDGWLSLYFLAAMACSIERKCGRGEGFLGFVATGFLALIALGCLF